MTAWRAAPGHVDLAVRVKPRAGRDAIEGVESDADGSDWLVIRVHAIASGGKANAAVLDLLAERLGLARSSFSLLSGQMARKKRVRIVGDPPPILSSLEMLAS